MEHCRDAAKLIRFQMEMHDGNPFPPYSHAFMMFEFERRYGEGSFARFVMWAAVTGVALGIVVSMLLP